MLRLPLVCARGAAGGITNSLGSGRIELSMVINSTMRGYPPDSNEPRYQSINSLNMTRGGYSENDAAASPACNHRAPGRMVTLTLHKLRMSPHPSPLSPRVAPDRKSTRL